MKPKELQVRKRTYTRDELNILLLKEAFERDLSLFASLLQKKEGFFEEPFIGDGWTFTVVHTGTTRELFINLPASNKKN
jgi:hypothetical protein